MTLSYTVINTTPEDLGDRNFLHIEAYDMIGIGTLVKTYIQKPFTVQVPRSTNPVTFKTEQINPIISEKSLTIKFVALSEISALVSGGSIPWTTLLVESLPRGQSRITRAVTVPEKGSLIHVYTKSPYKESNKRKLTVSLESLHWAEGAAIDDSDLIYGNAETIPQFGEIWTNGNGATTALSGLSTWAKFEGFSQNGYGRGAVPDHTSDHITISRNGRYFISVAVSFFGGANATYEIGVKRNSGALSFGNLHTERKLNAAGDISSASIGGITSLSASNTIELWVQQTLGTLVNPTLKNVTLSVFEIGK